MYFDQKATQNRFLNYLDSEDGQQWVREVNRFNWIPVGKIRHLLGYALDHLDEDRRLIVCCPVITGRLGASLVLGSFESCDTRDLFNLAAKLANLYTHGPRNQYEAELASFVNQATYSENRRQRIPDRFSGGLAVWLFDIYLSLSSDCVAIHESLPYVACIASIGNEGSIFQLPWDQTLRSVFPVPNPQDVTNLISLEDLTDGIDPEVDWIEDESDNESDSLDWV